MLYPNPNVKLTRIYRNGGDPLGRIPPRKLPRIQGVPELALDVHILQRYLVPRDSRCQGFVVDIVLGEEIRSGRGRRDHSHSPGRSVFGCR